MPDRKIPINHTSLANWILHARLILISVILSLMGVTFPAYAADAIITGGGMNGGGVNAIIVDQNNAIYVGTPLGIYKTTDNGVTWKAMSNGLLAPNTTATIPSVYKLFIDNAGNIYALSNSGIFRSSNGGSDWSIANTGLPPSSSSSSSSNYRTPSVSMLVKDSNNVLYALTDGGLYKSSNAASSWSAVGGVPPITFSSLAVDKNNNVYLGTSGFGVFKSSDAGKTWTIASAGLKLTYVKDLLADADGNLYAAVGSGNSYYYPEIYKSTDGAANWSKNFPITINSASDYYSAAFFTDNANAIYFTFGTNSGKNYIVSNDGGASWNTASPFKSTTNVFCFDQNGNTYTGTTGGGIFKNIKGTQTWLPLNGLTGTGINSVVSDKNGVVYIGASDGSVYKSDNGGKSWGSVGSGLSGISINRLFIDAKGNVFASTNYFSSSGSATYRLAAGSLSWAKVSDLQSNYSSTSLIFIDDGKGNIFAGDERSSQRVLWMSTDAGLRWTEISNNGLPTNNYFYTRQLAIDNMGTVYAATNYGLYRSFNAGNSWSLAGNLPTFDITGVAADGKGAIYAATSGIGLFKSTNNGVSWTTINKGLPSFQMGAIKMDDLGNIYVSSSSSNSSSRSIYISADGGQNWSPLKAQGLDLSSGSITTLGFDAAGKAYLGTPNGLLQFTISAAQPFSITGTATGTINALTLKANIKAASFDQGLTGNLYVAAVSAKGDSVAFYSPTGWTPFGSSSIPAFQSNVTLGSHTLTILDGTVDMTNQRGMTFYAGYGTDINDLINNQKFSMLYTLP